MKTEQYNQWIKSHQVEAGDMDISGAVMNRIAEETHRPNVFKRTWENVLLDLIQTKALVRVCVLASGALMGLVRLFVQMYSVLFT